MSVTFLQLTNLVLERLNEVKLDSTTFASAVGFPASVKSAVNSAINDIHTDSFDWPFNYAKQTQVLIPGTYLYTFPTDMQVVDWESFYLNADNTLPVQAAKLRKLDYNDWQVNHRASDDNASQGNVPQRTFPTPDNNWGVSPHPDKAYTISYEYFKLPVDLVNATDTTTIPDIYQQVIIDGAMYYSYLFRENFEMAELIQQKFDKGIGHMRTILVNKQLYVTDTRTGSVISPF